MGEGQLAGKAGRGQTAFQAGDWFPLCAAWGREGALCPWMPAVEGEGRGRAHSQRTFRHSCNHPARLCWPHGTWRLPFTGSRSSSESSAFFCPLAVCLSAYSICLSGTCNNYETKFLTYSPASYSPARLALVFSVFYFLCLCARMFCPGVAMSL